MLVLSRKLNEKTVIITASGERIEVVLVDIDRGKVRLGFAADRSVQIFREELVAPGQAMPPRTEGK